MNTTKVQAFEAYIEGVSVPFTGGSLNSSIGEPATLQLTFPYSRYYQQLRAGSIVTVTYKDSLGEEKLLFDGCLGHISISGNGTAKQISISATSPIYMLSRFKKYLDQNIAAPISSASNFFLYPDSLGTLGLAGPLSLKDSDLIFQDAAGRPLTDVLSDPAESFPESIHNTAVDSIRSVGRGGQPTTAASHEALFSYMDQFEFIQMYTADDSFDRYRKFISFASLNPALDNRDFVSNPSYYLFMSQLYSKFHYLISDLGIPHKSVSGTDSLGSCVRTIVTPSNPFLAPPMCNVITPSIVKNASYSLPFGSEVTRGTLVSGTFLVSTNISADIYPSPSSLFSETLNSNVGSEFYSETIALDESFNNTELYVGPQAMFTQMNRWQTYSRSDQADPIDKAASKEYISKYADLAFLTRKYANRRCDVTTTFNPKICPGFTALLLDIDQPIQFFVTSVRHSFHRNGSSGTTIAGSHALTSMDWVNPDLRMVCGSVEETLPDSMSEQYERIGLGKSVRAFVNDVSDAHSNASTLRGILNRIVEDSQENLGDTLFNTDPSGLAQKIMEVSSATDSTRADKIDEGFGRLIDIEVLMSKIRDSNFNQDSINEYLELYSGRQAINANHTDSSGLPWSGDPFISRARGYWLGNLSQTTAAIPEEHVTLYNIRRKGAEKFAEDLNAGLSRAKSAKSANIENSIVALFSENIFPKSEGEESGLIQ